MGMTTYLYGCILEYGLNLNKLEEVKTHNNRIIENLPVNDNWPPLSREMFAVTNNHKSQISGTYLEYTGRLIHFGASFKSIEHEWLDWKTKFENLLTRLYWLDAHVHLQTEYNHLESFRWSVDLKRWSIGSDAITPIKDEHWNFNGADSWYAKSAS